MREQPRRAGQELSERRRLHELADVGNVRDTAARKADQPTWGRRSVVPQVVPRGPAAVHHSCRIVVISADREGLGSPLRALSFLGPRHLWRVFWRL